MVVSGTSDGLRSRIVVFYDKPLKSLEHNGSARLVSRNVVCNPKEFNIVVNGSGDVKLGRVNTKNAKLVINNEGSIYIRKVSIDNVQTEINGSGELIMQEGADLINK